MNISVLKFSNEKYFLTAIIKSKIISKIQDISICDFHSQKDSKTTHCFLPINEFVFDKHKKKNPYRSLQKIMPVYNKILTMKNGSLPNKLDKLETRNCFIYVFLTNSEVLQNVFSINERKYYGSKKSMKKNSEKQSKKMIKAFLIF